MILDIFFWYLCVAFMICNDVCLPATHYTAKVPVATVLCYNEYGPLTYSLALFSN